MKSFMRVGISPPDALSSMMLRTQGCRLLHSCCQRSNQFLAESNERAFETRVSGGRMNTVSNAERYPRLRCWNRWLFEGVNRSVMRTRRIFREGIYRRGIPMESLNRMVSLLRDTAIRV
ncbi:hypothetical protein QYF36_021283 [Acer negundo]|nr:hypothetical protein QYF36_021283 [Acer negundo]